MPRDYRTEEEIHMEPGDIHEPTNTIPSYPSELESALNKVANSDSARLKGTAHNIASRRIERMRDTRFLGNPTDWKQG
ncbi:MAG: hypothetical protein ACRD0Q_08605 [Acidimicrobiales bacterium]